MNSVMQSFRITPHTQDDSRSAKGPRECAAEQAYADGTATFELIAAGRQADLADALMADEARAARASAEAARRADEAESGRKASAAASDAKTAQRQKFLRRRLTELRVEVAAPRLLPNELASIAKALVARRDIVARVDAESKRREPIYVELTGRLAELGETPSSSDVRPCAHCRGRLRCGPVRLRDCFAVEFVVRSGHASEFGSEAAIPVERTWRLPGIRIPLRRAGYY